MPHQTDAPHPARPYPLNAELLQTPDLTCAHGREDPDGPPPLGWHPPLGWVSGKSGAQTGPPHRARALRRRPALLLLDEGGALESISPEAAELLDLDIDDLDISLSLRGSFPFAPGLADALGRANAAVPGATISLARSGGAPPILLQRLPAAAGGGQTILLWPPPLEAIPGPMAYPWPEGLEEILDRIPAQLYVRDETGRLVYVNPALADLRGETPAQTLAQGGGPWDASELAPGFDRVEDLQLMRSQRTLSGDARRLADARGLRYDLLVSKVCLPLPGGRRQGVLGIGVDITLLQAQEDALRQRAFYDPLTQLPNRDLLLDRILQALRRRQRQPGQELGLLFLDLNDFKTINDSWGHSTGDQILIHLAQRLLACIRPGDTVSRLGGDEFVVLLPSLTSPREALPVAERIHAALSLPFLLPDAEITTSASIGVAISGPGSPSPQVLIAQADAAMYQAKADGAGRTRLYTPTLREGSSGADAPDLRDDLLQGMALDHLYLAYQPIIDLQDGSLLGLEALPRWRHPSLGLLHPRQFIPSAAASGAIAPLERWILQRATTAMVGLIARGAVGPGVHLSLNVAPEVLSRADFLSELDRILGEVGLPAERLNVDVSEASLMEHPTSSARALTGLRQRGASVTLDHFGQRVSSFSHLYRFPISGLKFDRHHFGQRAQRPREDRLIRAVFSMGQALELEVTAEGIEREDQLPILHEIGCRRGQGFFFSPALPLDKLASNLFAASPAPPSSA